MTLRTDDNKQEGDPEKYDGNRSLALISDFQDHLILLITMIADDMREVLVTLIYKPFLTSSV